MQAWQTALNKGLFFLFSYSTTECLLLAEQRYLHFIKKKLLKQWNNFAIWEKIMNILN